MIMKVDKDRDVFHEVLPKWRIVEIINNTPMKYRTEEEHRICEEFADTLTANIMSSGLTFGFAVGEDSKD